MTLSGLGLIILSAILHASWNLISKHVANVGYPFVFAHRIWSTVVYLPWIVYIFYTETFNFNPVVVACLFLTAVLHLIYSMSLVLGYQKADLSIVYPVARGSGPLFTSLVAFFLFDESLGGLKVFGIACICSGVLLIAMSGSLRAFILNPSWIGIRWGLFIGVLIASYSIVDAYAVKTLLIAPVLVSWVSSFGGLCLLLPRVWLDRTVFKARMRGNWRYAAYVGVASPVAYILVLYVLQSGAHVSVVAPVRELSLVIATLAGVVLLKESVSITGWLGCLAILSGVILLAS